MTFAKNVSKIGLQTKQGQQPKGIKTMMNELRNGIERARNKKQLDRILDKALKEFGFLSKRYNEILDLCYNKWDKIISHN